MNCNRKLSSVQTHTHTKEEVNGMYVHQYKHT